MVADADVADEVHPPLGRELCDAVDGRCGWCGCECGCSCCLGKGGGGRGGEEADEDVLGRDAEPGPVVVLPPFDAPRDLLKGCQRPVRTGITFPVNNQTTTTIVYSKRQARTRLHRVSRGLRGDERQGWRGM